MRRSNRALKRYLAMMIVIGLVLLAQGTILIGAEEEEEDAVVIIVHIDSEIVEMSRTTLKRLFKGQLQTNHEILPGSSAPIHRILLVLAQPTQDTFLHKYLELSTRNYWRYWAGRVLAGDNLRTPMKEKNGSDTAKRVAGDARLIGVVLAADVTEGVRVVSITR